MLRLLAGLMLACLTLPAQAGAILTEMQALLRTSTSDRETVVELLADASGGVATGILAGGPSGYPPDPIRWVMGIEPTPFQPVLTFRFDNIGNYLGVEPTPFEVISTTTGKLYGTLNFDDARVMRLGSLRGITGVTLSTPTGLLTVDPFDIVSVPEPSTALLLAGALVGLYGRRRSSR